MIGAAGRRSATVYQLLLLAYPAGFREQYGRDMAQLFQDRLAETRTLGERIVQWSRTVWDSVSEGLSERWLVFRARAVDSKNAIRRVWTGDPRAGRPIRCGGGQSETFATRRVPSERSRPSP